MSEIYEPSEDSYLMSLTLEKEIPKLLYKNNKLKFLEIGSGSGINLQKAKFLGITEKNIFSIDINSEAVEYCKKLGFNCVKSNLFERVSGEYDLIIFNPPYLPEDKSGLESKESKIATTGGKKGNEIIIKFLKQAKSYLNKQGKIFVLTSSLTPKIDFLKLGYKSKIIQEKKLFYEKLFIWELVV